MVEIIRLVFVPSLDLYSEWHKGRPLNGAKTTVYIALQLAGSAAGEGMLVPYLPHYKFASIDGKAWKLGIHVFEGIGMIGTLDQPADIFYR